MTQARLGELCGVSREQVGKYERGKNAPGSEFLAAFASLGANISSLFPGPNDRRVLTANETPPAPYAGIRPDVVRIAIETLCMWLEKNDLHLAPASMAEAVLALCDIAASPEEVIERAPAALRMLKLAA